jgi:ParB family chromosome partitioning protein
MVKQKFELNNVFTSHLDEPSGQQELLLDSLVPWVSKDGKLQPFRVLADELPPLVESIKLLGVTSPLIVREKGDEYEIISGHRRAEAARLAGLTSVPVIIVEADDDRALCILCDSNLNNREKLLPSEKAFAYKLKLEALKRQGERSDLTSGQVVPKLQAREKVAQNTDESANQVSRCIRLTELLPDLLDVVDDNKLGFVPAVILSYLKSKEQQIVLDHFKRDQTLPSLNQATQLKALSQSGKLDAKAVEEIMTVQKVENKQVVLKGDKLEKYFSPNTPKKDMEKVIIELLEKWCAEKKKDAPEKER